MKINSRTLNEWKEELVEERIEYYNEKKDLLDRIKLAGREVYNLERSFSNKLYKDNEGFADDHYEKLWQALNDNEVYYDKEHFVRTRKNGTTFHIMFEGKKLYNYYKGNIINTDKYIMTYSLEEYYFLNYESKSLYNFLNKNNLDIRKESIKEVEKYIDKLLSRIVTTYGEVINVSDSYRGSIASVEFECEKGNCYLERILAGGYNIQKLHNRILVKEIK